MRFEGIIRNKCLLEPAFNNNDVAIVFIANKQNIGEIVTSIASIVDCTDGKEKLDIIILHNELDYYDEEMINHFAQTVGKNIVIHFI